MTESPTPDPLIELRYALAEADAQPLAAGFTDRVTTAAFADRPSGRPLHEPEWIGSTEVFKRATSAFDALIESLEEADWQQHTVRGLDVQELVGHLIGVEDDFQQVLIGTLDSRRPVDDHVGATRDRALAQRGRSTFATRDEWRRLVAGSLHLVVERGDLEEISLHGLVMPLESFLIVRSFELWTHEDDIRRATNRPLSVPDPPSLRRMVELSVQLLPLACRRRDDANAAPTARLVLIGEAGGTFDISIGSHPTEPVVRIVADVVNFCRLVANRMTGDDVALSVSGDRDLATRVLVGAATLALD